MYRVHRRDVDQVLQPRNAMHRRNLIQRQMQFVLPSNEALRVVLCARPMFLRIPVIEYIKLCQM